MLNRINQLQPRGNRSIRLVRTVLKIFGLMFLLYGALSLVNEIRLGQQSIQAIGKIFSVREAVKDNHPTYFPIVEFTALDGQVVHFQGTGTSSKPTEGAPVTVLYSGTKPEEARIDSFVQRWLSPSIYTLIGFLFLLAASYWRKRPTL